MPTRTELLTAEIENALQAKDYLTAHLLDTMLANGSYDAPEGTVALDDLTLAQAQDALDETIDRLSSWDYVKPAYRALERIYS